MLEPGVTDNRVLAADLLVIITSVILVVGIVFTPLSELRALAIVAGLLFILLVPGYALVSAVFPRAGELAPGSGTETSWLARIGASVAGSGIAITVVGGLLDFTIWGFDRAAILVGLSVLTVAATAVAWHRRRRLPTADQAGTDFDAVRSHIDTVVSNQSATSVILSIIVIITVAGAVGVVADESTSSGSVVELYVLGQDDSGELAAGSYPSNVTVGEPVTTGIGVGTSEAAFDGYVITRLERVTTDGDTVTVRESRQLGRTDVEVPAGERIVYRHTIQPSMAGERLRMTYRLYRTGSDSALRQVHVWVTVEPP
jgi:uncharacterized membrane protein